uniref:Uncharacterized protein n=1 Tax=Rhizophora mucronata TaxID=61149 RepID=A0A2P2QTT3_RHIMU
MKKNSVVMEPFSKRAFLLPLLFFCCRGF